MTAVEGELKHMRVRTSNVGKADKNWIRTKSNLFQNAVLGYIKSVLRSGSPSTRRPNLPTTTKTLEVVPSTPTYPFMTPSRMATLDFDRASDSKSKKKKKTAIKQMISMRLDVSDASARESEDVPYVDTSQPRKSKFVLKRRDPTNTQSGRKTLINSISGKKIKWSLSSSTYCKAELNSSNIKKPQDSSCFLKGLVAPRVKLAASDSNSTSTVYRLAAMDCSKKSRQLIKYAGY